MRHFATRIGRFGPLVILGTLLSTESCASDLYGYSVRINDFSLSVAFPSELDSIMLDGTLARDLISVANASYDQLSVRRDKFFVEYLADDNNASILLARADDAGVFSPLVQVDAGAEPGATIMNVLCERVLPCGARQTDSKLQVFEAQGAIEEGSPAPEIVIGSFPPAPTAAFGWLRTPEGPRAGGAPPPPVLEVPLETFLQRSRSDVAPEGRAREHVANDADFFVIHCTAGLLSEAYIDAYRGKRSKAHAYLMPSGKKKENWPFKERNVWATKTESCVDSKGTMYHVELNYACRNPWEPLPHAKPSDAQIDALAQMYVEGVGVLGSLTIVVHREVDRGIKNGHNDPTDFDIGAFYDKVELLMTAEGRPFDRLRHLEVSRYAYGNDAAHSHIFPPDLNGRPTSDAVRADMCKRRF